MQETEVLGPASSLLILKITEHFGPGNYTIDRGGRIYRQEMARSGGVTLRKVGTLSEIPGERWDG